MLNRMSALTKALTALDNKISQEDSPLPKRSCNYAILAKRGQGKTTLLLNLLTKEESPWYKNFNIIFYISPTARNDDKVMKFIEEVGEEYHYNDLNDIILREITDTIDAFKEDWKRKKKKSDPAFCIVYDDCIHLLKSKGNKIVNELATQNRHRQITNIYVIQKWNTFMPPLIRANLDLISIFATDNKKELNSFIEEMAMDETKLRALYEYATAEQYSFLHINCYKRPLKFYKKFTEIKYVSE